MTAPTNRPDLNEQLALAMSLANTVRAWEAYRAVGGTGDSARFAEKQRLEAEMVALARQVRGEM